MVADDSISVERGHQKSDRPRRKGWFPSQDLMHMAGQRGDDLEDDYVPDEFSTTSGDEEEYSLHGSSHGDLSLDDVPKPSGSTTHTVSENNNKRKRSRKDKQRRLKVIF